MSTVRQSCKCKIQGTYHRGLLTSRVVDKRERIVEVIEVHLALRLKLVKEVEEAECEGSAGAGISRWKPTGTKELATAGGGFPPGPSAQAVPDPYFVDAGDVEECKVDRVRRETTAFTDVVAELVRRS